MPASENNTTFVAADNSSLLGKELEFITIDAGEELANHQAKNETQNAIENTVRQFGNIVGAGPLFDTNASRTYIVEGTDMFVGSPATTGTGAFTFTESGADGSSVGTLVTALKALGTIDGIDLNDSGTTAKIENLEL
tara:strand:+ start:1023 stop:1433 length:411 start_codon:yes stop_codon:yes gene_type:complete